MRIQSLLFLLLFVASIYCYNNGVARTPPMGWNSWNQFACNIDEQLIMQTIDSFVKLNLTKYGYNYVVCNVFFFQVEQELLFEEH